MSVETVIFFLISPYKLNVIATVNPIQGNSLIFINRYNSDKITNIIEISWFLFNFSFKNTFPKKTLIIG